MDVAADAPPLFVAIALNDAGPAVQVTPLPPQGGVAAHEAAG